ncbi:MAG TPA: sugar transferase [Terriglobales bacterium]|nr:sugar transferase [Terriglobales bacterium]
MKTRRLEIWIWLADLAWISVAFLGANLLRYGTTWTPAERSSIHQLFPFIVATLITWSALSLFMQMDGFRGGWRLSAVFSQLLVAMCCTLAVLTILGYFSRTYVSRLALTYFMLLLAAGFVGVRFGARLMLRIWHDGGSLWRVLILGNGRVAQEVAAKIEQHPETLCRVVGLLFPNQDAPETLLLPAQNSQYSTLQIFGLLQELRVNEVIVALPYAPTAEIHKMIARARDMGISTSVVPQSYELYASRPRLFTLDGLPLLRLPEPGLSRRYVVLKRALDLVGACILSIPATLVLIPAAAALILKKRAAFRRETRVGHYGVPFPMWRLNVSRPVLTASRFERFLDRLSITELPQLWNVATGDMSLVGPRPEPAARTANYSDWQQRRLRVKPGMTGLAQVQGLREFSSSEQKARFDLQYVMDAHLLWDISLLLQTIWTLVMRLFSRVPSRQVYEMDWKTQDSAQGFVSNAHRSQPSAD